MLPPNLLEDISNSNCDIRHIDLSACSLTITDLEQLHAALVKNQSVRTISWPPDLVDDARILQIETYLTTRFGMPLGSKYVSEYLRSFGPVTLSPNVYTEAGIPLCFHEIVETLAAAPDSANLMAVQDSFTEFGLTYKELNAKANQLAHYLIQRKPAITIVDNKPKDIVVTVFLNRSIDYLIAILAVMKSGCAFFSLDTNSELMPEERAKQCCNAAKPAIIISQSRLEPRIKSLVSDVPIVLLDKIEISTYSTSNPNCRVSLQT